MTQRFLSGQATSALLVRIIVTAKGTSTCLHRILDAVLLVTLHHATTGCAQASCMERSTIFNLEVIASGASCISFLLWVFLFSGRFNEHKVIKDGRLVAFVINLVFDKVILLLTNR